MTAIVSIENVTSPDTEPVDGDMMRITYDDRTVVERVFSSVVVDVSPPPIRIISVGAFLDRLNVGGKMEVCYQMADAGKLADPPNYTLHTILKNLERRTYIHLNNPVLEPTLRKVGIHTEDELVGIFKDGTIEESVDVEEIV